MFGCQLQKIPVSGNYRHIQSLLLCQMRDRSQQIIRLQTGLFNDLYIHRRQHLLHKWNLFLQFWQHRLPGPLISVKHLMAESWCAHIKCHRQILGLFLIQYLKQDI